MNIAATQFSLNYSSFEIYVSGCDGTCEGCHNPELWDYSIGDPYETQIEKIKQKVGEFDSLIKWIWILGGEPLLQNTIELSSMLSKLRECQKPIVLFTRFELDQIPKGIVSLCDYIKTGLYIKELEVEDYKVHGIKLATSNQKVYNVRIGEIK